MTTRFDFPLRRTLLMVGLAGLSGVSVADESRLVSLINEYRQSPDDCGGQIMRPVSPLAPNDTLADVDIAAGKRLQPALKEAGYQASRAQMIGVSGPPDVQTTMDAIKKGYCQVLLSNEYAEVGVSRSGNRWQIVVAQPLLSDELGDWQEEGKRVLEAVNEARGQARACGTQAFGSAPALSWNDRLAATALAHSRDMADQNFFSHTGSDGSQVGERAKRDGYSWRRIGENIATGQGTAERAVAGWLRSPGHCANLMNPDFTQMGAAYATSDQSDTGIFWTQVFGRPR